MTGNIDRKTTTTRKNDKTDKKRWSLLEQKEKSNTSKKKKKKKKKKLEEINQKVLAKDGRQKMYRDKIKQYKQNKTFQNNER